MTWLSQNLKAILLIIAVNVAVGVAEFFYLQHRLDKQRLDHNHKQQVWLSQKDSLIRGMSQLRTIADTAVQHGTLAETRLQLRRKDNEISELHTKILVDSIRHMRELDAVRAINAWFDAPERGRLYKPG